MIRIRRHLSVGLRRAS